MDRDSIRSQLKRNAVALISLVIAITSLVYNTWRNEHTEFNRNQRDASFAILSRLGELEELTYLVHYDCNFRLRGNVRTGWALVQSVQDHAMVLQEFPSDAAAKLRDAWSENWQPLDYAGREACVERSAARAGKSRTATERIKAAIDELRAEVLDELRSLE